MGMLATSSAEVEFCLHIIECWNKLATSSSPEVEFCLRTIKLEINMNKINPDKNLIEMSMPLLFLCIHDGWMKSPVPVPPKTNFSIMFMLPVKSTGE